MIKTLWQNWRCCFYLSLTVIVVVGKAVISSRGAVPHLHYWKWGNDSIFAPLDYLEAT